MKKKFVYVLLAVMVFSFAGCNNQANPEGESGAVDSELVGKVAEEYSVPSEGEVIPFVEGVPDSFPKDKLVPKDAEVVMEETDNTTAKTIVNVTLRTTMSSEEISTFYNEALGSLGIENVEFTETNGTLSFTGRKDDDTQIDVSALPAADGNGYMVSINYYFYEKA